MKVIFSVACVLLACQFAAAASVPQVFQSEPRECALQVVDRIKANILTHGATVQARFDALKATYEQCVLLPERESIACLRQFARYAITVVQGLEPELEAKKIVLRYYALERLEDYHVCRNGPAAEARVPQLLCALRTYEDARTALQPYTDALLSHYDILRERFVGCLNTPEDLQATCLVTLFRQATVIGRDVYEQIQELRPIFVSTALELLEEYNSCRLA